MDLKIRLNSDNPGLYHHIEIIRDAAGKILDSPLHHHYTDHSLKHSDRVIKILNSLTEVETNSRGHLSSTELYVLLAAAYLHDVGMQDRRSILDEEYRSAYPDKSYYEAFIGALEQIRDRHHELTREMIFDHIFKRDGYVDLGLPRIPFVDEKVAIVAEGHRKVDLSLASFDDTIDESGDPIRSRLLAALLRFADELDIDHNRVYMDRLKLINPPIRSRYYWYLSYYIQAVQIQEGMITICYRFPLEHRDYEELIEPLVENPIRSKYDELIGILWPQVKLIVNPSSKRQFSQLIEPLPPDVEKFANEELSRSRQKEKPSAIPSLSPDPLVSEILDAR